MQSELLREDWKEKLAALFRSASESVLVSSPFVSRRGIDLLLDNLPKSIQNNGSIQALVNLSPQNILQGATEPESLQHLTTVVSNTNIHHLSRLHAKVYVADTDRAIITSGNLTGGGLDNNYEYGVSTSDGETISIIRDDLEEYAELGVRIDEDELNAYIKTARKVRASYQAQRETETKNARQNFERALVKANEELIRLRLRGESTNATFAKTILYLLRRKGPMATKDLHPHIQRIHPDLCDDSVDRVVEGENYGKRWKHRVRAAQSTLKQRGEIELKGGKWKLVRE